MDQIDHHNIWLNVVRQNDYHLGFNPMGETVWMSLHDVLEADMRDMLTGIERACYLMDDIHEDEHDRVVARKWTVTIVVAWVDLFCRALEHTVHIVSKGLVRRLAADGHLSEEVAQAHAASLQEVHSQTAHIEHCKDAIDKAEETYVATGKFEKLRRTVADLKRSLESRMFVKLRALLEQEKGIFTQAVVENYSPDEVRVVERAMFKALQAEWWALPHFYRRYSTQLRQRASLMHQQFGRGVCIQACCYSSVFQRYDRQYAAPMRQLITPDLRFIEDYEDDEYVTCLSCKTCCVHQCCSFGSCLRCCVCVPSVFFSYAVRDSKSILYRDLTEAAVAATDCLVLTPANCIMRMGYCFEDIVIDIKNLTSQCCREWHSYCCDFSYCGTCYNEVCWYPMVLSCLYLGIDMEARSPSARELRLGCSEYFVTVPRVYCSHWCGSSLVCCLDVGACCWAGITCSCRGSEDEGYGEC